MIACYSLPFHSPNTIRRSYPHELSFAFAAVFLSRAAAQSARNSRMNIAPPQTEFRDA